MARAKKKAAPKKKPAAKKKVTAKKKVPAKKKAAAAKNKVTAKKRAPKKSAAAKKKVPAKKRVATKTKPRRAHKKRVDAAELFAQLTEGERADALRILLEDARLAAMAKVGRYRVIAVEPLALKSDPKHARRIARIVIYDYSADRCVQANVDLDSFEVRDLTVDRSQPMLAEEEELAAMEVAIADKRVCDQLGLGEVPQSAMHYWSQRVSDLSHNRRSAAVLLGEPGARPSLVAIVDLLDAQVTKIVAAQLW